MYEINIYTDGACIGNPGPGGWAAVLEVLQFGRLIYQQQVSGHAEHTTNNKMELTAAIKGLQILDAVKLRTDLPFSTTIEASINLITDSNYVLSGITAWIYIWKKDDWRRKTVKGWEPVKNKDLWMQLDEARSQRSINFLRAPGHSGNKGNEAADFLARSAACKAKGE